MLGVGRWSSKCFCNLSRGQSPWYTQSQRSLCILCYMKIIQQLVANQKFLNGSGFFGKSYIQCIAMVENGQYWKMWPDSGQNSQFIQLFFYLWILDQHQDRRSASLEYVVDNKYSIIKIFRYLTGKRTGGECIGVQFV